MEHIHEFSKKPWISNKIIHMKKSATDCEAQLEANGVTFGEKLELEAQSSDDQNLEDRIVKFIQGNEQFVKPCFLFNSTDERALIDEPKCTLKLYSLQLQHAKKIISDQQYKASYLTRLKTRRRELLMRHLALMNRSPADNQVTVDRSSQQTASQNNLIAVAVVQIWPQPRKFHKVKLEREVLFRADQCLTNLRDQFKCQRDYGVPMDLSENPDQGERVFKGEMFKSGFFLIEDTFYNDMRDQNNVDLSAPIIEWASKEVVVLGEDGDNLRRLKGLGPFKSVRMEDVKFEDLTFRLGCLYLYLHQGYCEHLFSISDIRYVPNDVHLQTTRFPFVTATSVGGKGDNLSCYMCRSRPPHWYTRNHERLPVDPYFFCENCFYSFNYRDEEVEDTSRVDGSSAPSIKRRKIGNFQAYLYTSPFGIPDSVSIQASSSLDT